MQGLVKRSQRATDLAESLEFESFFETGWPMLNTVFWYGICMVFACDTQYKLPGLSQTEKHIPFPSFLSL